MTPLNLEGQRFGTLVAKHHTSSNSRGNRLWYCECDCGGNCEVVAAQLKGGVTTCCLVCGMDARMKNLEALWDKSRLSERPWLREHPRYKEYCCWRAAKARCFNPTEFCFHYYGGRGITMCDRWKNSFDCFFEDMGPRPDNTSLDRFPNNESGNYEPGNCRWATKKQQANNRRPRRKRVVIEVQKAA